MLFIMPNGKPEKKQISAESLSTLNKKIDFPAFIKNNILYEKQVKPFVAAEVVTAKPKAKKERVAKGYMEQGEEFTINPEAVFAGYNETPDSTKELIYKEETQHGTVTQSYKLILIKGEWIIQPQWMILETNPDTTRRMPKDTLPPIQ